MWHWLDVPSLIKLACYGNDFKPETIITAFNYMYLNLHVRNEKIYIYTVSEGLNIQARLCSKKVKEDLTFS